MHHTQRLCNMLLKQSAFILRMYLHPVFCEWIRHKHGKLCNAIYLQNLDNHHSNKLLERIQVCWDVTLCWLRVQRHGVTFQRLEPSTLDNLMQNFIRCTFVTAKPLKPSGHYMYRQFNIQQFHVLPTQCIYVFCVALRTNSHYFLIQH